MKLYKFLNETSYVKLHECVELIRKNCLKNWTYYKAGKFNGIWRGDNKRSSSIGLFTGTTIRKSAHTTNHYTTLFSDILPSWKSLPKRNKSIICSLDKYTASEFGNAYFVLPYDSANIGYANAPDFWFIIKNNSKLNFLIDLTAFNEQLFVSLGISSSELKSVVNMSIDKFIDKYQEQDKFYSWLAIFTGKDIGAISSSKSEVYYQNMKDKYKNVKLLDFLDKILNPKLFNVESKKYTNLVGGDVEVWTDGPALLISEDVFFELKQILKKML